MKHSPSFFAIAVCGTAALFGCDKDQMTEGYEPVEKHSDLTRSADPETAKAAEQRVKEGPKEDAIEAEAELAAADGEEIDGEVHFHDIGTGVHLVAEIEDASPGPHGIHIHEKGDCGDLAGKSMGGHFDPENHPHALPSEAYDRHLGDLGNITIGEGGEGRLEMTLSRATLKRNDPTSLLGKAVVVHRGEDQGRDKQPAGNSGDVIACGVIEKS